MHDGMHACVHARMDVCMHICMLYMYVSHAAYLKDDPNSVISARSITSCSQMRPATRRRIDFLWRLGTLSLGPQIDLRA